MVNHPNRGRAGTIYSVWHELVSGRDGDTSYKSLADAETRFEELAGRSDVAEVELTRTTGDAEPVTLRRWGL